MLAAAPVFPRYYGGEAYVDADGAASVVIAHAAPARADAAAAKVFPVCRGVFFPPFFNAFPLLFVFSTVCQLSLSLFLFSFSFFLSSLPFPLVGAAGAAGWVPIGQVRQQLEPAGCCRCWHPCLCPQLPRHVRGGKKMKK